MSLCSELLGCDPGHTKLYSRDHDLCYHQCLDCGIIWRDKSSFHLEKTYDQHYFDSKNYQKNRRHKVKKSGWLLDMALSYRSGLSSMLEIGCSLGNTLEAADSRGIGHLGIDVSEYAVNYCLHHGLNASNQSLDQLLMEKRSFQLVFMQHVLEHFKDPFKILRQSYSLLEPKGLMVILIPNAGYRRSQKLRERHKFYSKKGVGLEHYVYFTYQNLERVLNHIRFNLIQKNYPLGSLAQDSANFYLNRIGRRALSLFNLDQELIIIAERDS